MTRIILIGMKGCGKTTVGKILSQKLGIPFMELDSEIEKKHLLDKREKSTFREIYDKYGKKYFRNLEMETLENLSITYKNSEFVFATGGGTPLMNKNWKNLKRMGMNIFIDTDRSVLLQRILKDGIPAFFTDKDNPEKSLDDLLVKRKPIYQKLASLTVPVQNETADEIADIIIERLEI